MAAALMLFPRVTRVTHLAPFFSIRQIHRGRTAMTRGAPSSNGKPQRSRFGLGNNAPQSLRRGRQQTSDGGFTSSSRVRLNHEGGRKNDRFGIGNRSDNFSGENRQYGDQCDRFPRDQGSRFPRDQGSRFPRDQGSRFPRDQQQEANSETRDRKPRFEGRFQNRTRMSSFTSSGPFVEPRDENWARPKLAKDEEFGPSMVPKRKPLQVTRIRGKEDDDLIFDTKKKTFESLGLIPELVDILRSQKISHPTQIQAACFWPFLEGKDLVVASHTGSGKTLAYLLPLFQKLLTQKQEQGILTRVRRPRAAIVLPTSELVRQIQGEADKLNKNRVLHIASSMDPSLLKNTVDILVSTPDKLLQAKQQERVFLTDLSCVVFDEADTLFDETYVESAGAILTASKGSLFRSLPHDESSTTSQPSFHDAQAVFVSATFQRAVLKDIFASLPALHRVSTPSMHQPPPNVDHVFIRVVGSSGKIDELLKILTKAKKRRIIFCHTVKTCQWVGHTLREAGIPRGLIHGEIHKEERLSQFEDFQAKKLNTLVCTDLASRGLDPLDVAEVVLYDFPGSTSDYLHRCGRTGRIGKKGTVISLLSKNDSRNAHIVQKALHAHAMLPGLTKDLLLADSEAHLDL